jgi:hypothetical protein
MYEEKNKLQATLELRCSVKDFLILIVFVLMVVGPVFTGLNVFTEKNRF